jgi:hypothetical protein
MVRFQIDLTEEEVKKLTEIAKKQGRSRKTQSEFFIRKMIQDESKK